MLTALTVLAIHFELITLDTLLKPEPRESREQQKNPSFSTLTFVKSMLSIINVQMENIKKQSQFHTYTFIHKHIYLYLNNNF